jgi:uncharacterized protein (DUF58 family)
MAARISLRERFDPRRFFQGGKPIDGLISLGHRNVYIIPNKRGLGLALLLLLQLVASINYNNSLGFILSFLLGSIAMLGSVYGFRNLAGLTVRAGRSEPVFVGEAAKFKLSIDNPTQTPRIGLDLGLRKNAAGKKQKRRVEHQQTVDLLPGEPALVVLSLQAEQRGWLDLPTVTLSSVFPLGIFYAWSPLRLKERALVYPRPAPDSLPFPSAPGEGDGQRRISTDDFYGFQNYQPGDPLRRIHWKGVAKGQGVHVKEYRGEESVLLYLDFAHTPGRDVEAKLSRLCRWLLDAEQSGAVYGLRLPGTDIKPASGQAHLRMCLESLALFPSSVGRNKPV